MMLLFVPSVFSQTQLSNAVNDSPCRLNWVFGDAFVYRAAVMLSLLVVCTLKRLLKGVFATFMYVCGCFAVGY